MKKIPNPNPMLILTGSWILIISGRSSTETTEKTTPAEK
jgi:hypothetical protein